MIMKNIALFASGNGTNVEQICLYLKGNTQVKVACVVVNNKSAYVIQRAKRLNIPCYYFNREDFYRTDKVLKVMQELQIDFIFLAGFLWLIPQNLLTRYPNKIINIHPALLPKYGGKGMYGHNVHQAVVDNKEKQSGITIHYVNEHYDQGKNIFQAKCLLNQTDNAEDVAQKIHLLEKEFYPKVVEAIVLNKALPKQTPFNPQILQQAIALANKNAQSTNGGPFAAIITKEDKIIAQACNSVTSSLDPTAHAEVNAIRLACKELKTFNLKGCDIYASCEPCPMCLSAIYWAHLDHIYYAADSQDAAKAGFDDSFIYKQISLEPNQRELPQLQYLSQEGKAPFDSWKENTNKIDY